MVYLRFLISFFVLFFATFILCWLFTCCWVFGPIVTLAAFLGGILLIGVLGVLSLNFLDSLQ